MVGCDHYPGTGAAVDRRAILGVMDVEVRHDPDEGRYDVLLDGATVGFAEYRLRGERILFLHTEVDPGHEGAGLASQLVREALADVREKRLELVPLCPFVAGYVRRHPDDYLDLVPESMRERVMAGD